MRNGPSFVPAQVRRIRNATAGRHACRFWRTALRDDYKNRVERNRYVHAGAGVLIDAERMRVKKCLGCFEVPIFYTMRSASYKQPFFVRKSGIYRLRFLARAGEDPLASGTGRHLRHGLA